MRRTPHNDITRSLISRLRVPTRPSPSMGFLFLSRSNASSPSLSLVVLCLGLPRPSGRFRLPWRHNHVSTITAIRFALVRVRRTTESHCPTEGEGTSAHRGTLPRLHLQHAFVRVCRTGESHCPTEGEGTSAHRGTLPRLLLQFAPRLHWSFCSSCPRPQTSGPRTCARDASLQRSLLRCADTAPDMSRPREHVVLLRKASWSSQWRGSLRGSGGGGGGAAGAFTNSWLGVMCAR